MLDHKRYLLGFALMLCSAASFAQINFTTDKKWGDVLAQAKADNKLIFVDVTPNGADPANAWMQKFFR